MSTTAKIITVAVIVIAVVASLITWRITADSNSQFRTVTTTFRSIYQDVTFTGKFEPSQNVDLGFEVTGKIQSVFVNVGDTVVAGQLLAQLDPTLASLELAVARANQSSAQHESYLAWQKAAADYTNTKATNAQTVEKKRQAVRDAKTELDQDKKVHEQTALESGDTAATTEASIATLKLAESTYHAAQQALSETIKSTNESDDAARASADIAYAKYLATKQTAGDVAGLSSLQASRELARAKLNKTSIIAPINGVMTSVDKKTGEIVAAGENVLTIQTTDQLGITADVPETDATKLTTGLSATVTLDAYPNADSLTATVTKIAPAAVIIEGVPTYKTTLRLNSPADDLKPGLTANVNVHADQRDSVIAVPRRAVIQRDDRQIVRVLGEDSRVAEREVVTGLLGSDGTIEIVSGLSENESVIIGSL
ncbi:MAG: efflux RND transporter periplasmic adaptor subunit [bacterium]